MKQYSFAERVFMSELVPHLERVKQRRREKRHRKVDWSFSEQKRIANTHHYSRGLFVLIQAGFTYEQAKELLE